MTLKVEYLGEFVSLFGSAFDHKEEDLVGSFLKKTTRG
jgi:hypothetical protein